MGGGSRSQRVSDDVVLPLLLTDSDQSSAVVFLFKQIYDVSSPSQICFRIDSISYFSKA